MRLILLAIALLLSGCATTPQPAPDNVTVQPGIAMISLVDKVIVHAFRAESTYANFDNQYLLTWNVSDLLVDATAAATDTQIGEKTTPQWLAKQQDIATRTDSGQYMLDRTTADQLKRYCVAQNLGTIILWLNDNQNRTVQGRQYALLGNGAVEIETPGVDPFIAYNSVLGIGVECQSGRIAAAVRDTSLQRIASFRPPPEGLPQLELDKTRAYFEQQSQQLAADLSRQMGIAR